MTKTAQIRLASWIALVGNAALAVLKITTGLVAHSRALVGDGIDSSTDVLLSVAMLVVLVVLRRPPDAGHPWGHGRAEIIATTGLAFVLFFAGGQFVWSAAQQALAGAPLPMPSKLAVWVALVSMLCKALLALSQHVLGKRAQSPLVRSNAKNMAGDILLSGGVLLGLFLSQRTGSGLADLVLSALVGLWVIKVAFGIFWQSCGELMDGGTDAACYQILFEAVESVAGADRPHRARMRRIAGQWDIDMDIEVQPELTVREAHAIATQVEQEVKRRLDPVFDIMVHVEPRNDSASEAYGLARGENQSS